MDKTIPLFKRKTRALPATQFAAMARSLGLEGKVQATDEALCATDGRRTLAYAQPCTPFSGLLFFSDQSVAWGEVGGKVLGADQARAWTQDLLKKFDLLPHPQQDPQVRFDFSLEARETEAIVFDGRERKRVKAKTDVTSRAMLGDVEVVGPRAKARLVFKDGERPVMMHLGLWESLAVHEERDRVSEHEVARTVADKLAQRRECDGRAYRLFDMRLVYMAGEFRGAPDLLAPEYLVEIELRDPRHDRKNPPIPPRQVLRLPAWR